MYKGCEKKKTKQNKRTYSAGPVRTFINRMQKNRIIIIIVPGLTAGEEEIIIMGIRTLGILFLRTRRIIFSYFFSIAYIYIKLSRRGLHTHTYACNIPMHIQLHVLNLSVENSGMYAILNSR